MTSVVGKTLVMGVSLKSERYSHQAVLALRHAGFGTCAWGLRAGKIKDVQIETELSVFGPVHTVSVYLGAKNQTGIISYLREFLPRRVIFNPGAENPDLFNELTALGVECENACTLILLRTGQY